MAKVEMMGVSGSGIQDVEGVFEEERDDKGSDAGRHETLKICEAFGLSRRSMVTRVHME